MKSSQNVRVGIGFIVVRDKKVLVGKRKGSHAAGLYSFPGGHQDFNETWEECVLRELLEECGSDLVAKIRPIGVQKAVFVTNDIMPQYDKHYITVFMVADWVAGEAQNVEPHKCEGWEWVSYDQLVALDVLADWIPLKYMELSRDLIGI